MTEIVQNNNSMKFDLLETGNSSSSGPDSNNLFNNLLGNVDIENTDREQDNQMSVDEGLHADKKIHEILSVLSEGNLKLDEDTIKEIKIRLKYLFEMIELNVGKEANINPEQAHGLINENFLHLMKFLKELEGLIGNQPNNKNTNRNLDLVLDKLRTKLNEQLKNILGKKSNINVKALNNANTTTDNEQISQLKVIPNAQDKNQKELQGIQDRIASHGSSKNSDIKIDLDANYSPKAKSLNSSHQQENKITQFSELGNKANEKNMDVMSKNSTSGMLAKELNSEPTLFRQPITLTNKLDTPSHSESLSAQKPSVFSQENNEKLFQTLNMLSRNWGNKLIDKIEKSIVDGIEQLEISLTPKSLGRLNVTINIHDTIAKINIVAESASAAALLGEAEQKLSQMMEASGLKLASLQTLTQQFGGNHRGKGQEHKLASTEKKSKIEQDLNIPENVKNINSESEGLNLIA